MNFSKLTRKFSFEFNHIKLSQVEILNFTYRIRFFSGIMVFLSLQHPK